MDEFVCVTLTSNPNESQADFKTRLYAFWTHMLRNKPDDYELVYAEATAFETVDDHVTRQYMVQTEGVAVLTAELHAHNIAFQPVDFDECYSKYEATSPDWFQLEH